MLAAAGMQTLRRRLADSAPGEHPHHRCDSEEARARMDEVIATVDRHANTSAASVPLALDEAVRDGRIKAGQHVMLEGVGGGFTWGAVLVRWSRIRVIRMKLAFVFPGQGSQSGRHDGGVRATASPGDVRRSVAGAGTGLWQLVADGPAEALNATVNTQPVMLTAGFAVYRAWHGARRHEPAHGRRPQPRRIHGAGRRGCARLRRCGAAGAIPRAGDAGSGARGHRRDGRDTRPLGRRCVAPCAREAAQEVRSSKR